MRTSMAFLASCAGLGLAGCHGAAFIAEPLRHTEASPDGTSQGADIPKSRSVVRAESHDGAMWLFTKDGALLSLETRSKTARRHLTQERVLGLLKTGGGELWALSADRQTDDFRFWRRDAGAWTPQIEWMGSTSKPLAVADGGGAPVLVTRGALLRATPDSEPGEWSLDATSLDADLDDLSPAPHALYTPAGHIVVAGHTRAGRGRVYVIDEDGHVEAPLFCDPNTMSGSGGEDAACPAVTGLVADRDDGSCVLVATEHTSRLQRVCDGRVESVRGPWQELAFEDAADLGSLFETALSAPCSSGDDIDLCESEPEYSGIDPFSGPAFAVVRGRREMPSVLGLVPVGEGLRVVLRDAVVELEEGRPLRVRVREQRSRSPDVATELALDEAFAPLPATDTGTWGPKLPACFHPEGTQETLCLDAGRFVFGAMRPSADGKSRWRAGGAVAPSTDVVGSWSATLSSRHGNTLRIFVEGDRALLIDTKTKPSRGVVLERFDAETEAALLRERGL